MKQVIKKHRGGGCSCTRDYYCFSLVGIGIPFLFLAANLQLYGGRWRLCWQYVELQYPQWAGYTPIPPSMHADLPDPKQKIFYYFWTLLFLFNFIHVITVLLVVQIGMEEPVEVWVKKLSYPFPHSHLFLSYPFSFSYYTYRVCDYKGN